MKISVDKDSQGERLDQYLHQRFPDHSRTSLQRLISDGLVKVKGSKVTKRSYEVSQGDVIDVCLPQTEQTPTVTHENIPLDIIYEDEHLLAINKPPGMIVHPTRGGARGTLANALVYHCQKLSGAYGPLRPGIVHRLDKDTSGVILAVKNEQVHYKIAKQFENRKIKKEYLCIAEGETEFDSDSIESPVGRHIKRREKMAIRRDAGKEATTTYEVIERFRGYTFVKVMPKTGRTHQIRVHLQSIGHPPAADPMYSSKGPCYKSLLLGNDHPEENEIPLIERQALHSHKIRFHHPALHEDMEFTAEIPQDIARLLAALREIRKQ